jgi:predicted DNA-binding transcriptional regulator AlpA
MLNFKQVVGRYGVNRATIFRWMGDKKFPQPERDESQNLIWDEKFLDLWDAANKAPERLLKMNSADLADKIEERDAFWWGDLELMHAILRDCLKLPKDCDNKTLCDAVIQYLEKTAKLERLVRELQPLVDKTRPESDDSRKADGQ